MTKERLKNIKENVYMRSEIAKFSGIGIDSSLREELELIEEIDRLNNIINELKEYEYAVYKIKQYINSYNPYFIDTQEKNNKKIANIINEIGKEKIKG